MQIEKELSDAKRAIRISSQRLEKSRRHAEYQILALTSKQAVLQNLEVSRRFEDGILYCMAIVISAGAMAGSFYEDAKRSIRISSQRLRSSIAMRNIRSWHSRESRRCCKIWRLVKVMRMEFNTAIPEHLYVVISSEVIVRVIAKSAVRIS